MLFANIILLCCFSWLRTSGEIYWKLTRSEFHLI